MTNRESMNNVTKYCEGRSVWVVMDRGGYLKYQGFAYLREKVYGGEWTGDIS